ncbi:exosortase/archaeosortase family protein [Oceanicoccus sagamiensis]|uniref:exosortase/archaeosortase family protein n=1 Tax=Oceanicoccus sagamiensis TaxID=716816 RepID=UPI0023E3EB32|nr:exosortase/archaeosortase family protein [Oceanicoccus sagamiensis]
MFKPFVGILLILLALFIAYSSTFNVLYQRWITFDESLSHGLLIWVLFFYLIWIYCPLPKVENNLAVKSVAIILLVVCSLLWFLFNQIQIYILAQVILLPILFFAIAAAYSFGSAIYLLGPISFLLFALPVWDHLNNLLLDLSSLVVGAVVHWMGIPALVEGNNILLPFGSMLIADGCSGIRYFIVSIAIAYFLCCINGYRWSHRLLVLVGAVLLGLLINWIRIVILVVVGYTSEMQSPLIADHEYFGWGLFIVCCFPFMYFLPVVDRAKLAPPYAAVNVKGLALAIIMLFAGAALNVFLEYDPKAEAKIRVADYLSCSLVENRTQWMEVTVPSGGLIEQGVLDCNNNIVIHHAQYQRDKANDRLMPYFARLYNYDTWVLQSESEQLFSGQAVNVQYFKRLNSSQKVVRLYWMDVGGYVTASYWKAKLLQIPARFSGKNVFSIVNMQARCQSDCAQETDQLAEEVRYWLDRKLED